VKRKGRIPDQEPQPSRSLNPESRKRRQLVFYIRTAQTPGQFGTAKKSVRVWMPKQPEDTDIERTGSELATKEAWLKMKGEWD
jgi:hypothetical protein